MKRPKTIPAVRPNVGIEAQYRLKLDALIEEMHASLLYWLSAGYKANPPEMAQDDSPANILRTIVRRLTGRWQANFNDAAPALAAYFAKSVYRRTDRQMMQLLKKHGISVEFKMTAAANDVMQATIGEQVGLIRSIAAEHLTQVEGLVMRSVVQGRNLSTLAAQLEARYAVTKRRAALISRDQNNKATAAITRVRQQSLGITEAIWLHSGGGKHPRPEHVAMSGKRYDVAKGAFLEGKWVWPGTEINCRCVTRSIIPGL